MTRPNRLLLTMPIVLGIGMFGFADTYIVTTTNATGGGSLWDAILNTEAHAGIDTIAFDIPQTDPGFASGLGVWVIQLTGTLPEINSNTIVDGTTQALHRGDLNPLGPEIEISGGGTQAPAFNIQGSLNEIRGLVINGFAPGMVIQGNGNIVAGNYIGTDASGTAAKPNTDGVAIVWGAKNNTIGGSSPEDGNLISGNEWSGVFLDQSGTTGNVVIGNQIGTDASGEGALGNGVAGVYIRYQANNNRIGGFEPGEGNIICGSYNNFNVFSGNGISIEEADSTWIVGNCIGTNKDALKTINNAYVGVLVYGSRSTLIGGIVPGQGNVISGNGYSGIQIRLTASTENTVAGNWIGTGMDGWGNLGNGYAGVVFDYGAQNNQVGPDNTIAYNGSIGVNVKHDSTTGNRITRNFIRNHLFAGICNDEGNLDLDPPIITNFTDTYVAGTALPYCIIEVFSDSLDEGGIFEGATSSGEFGTFAWVGVVDGPYATATATDTAGNTSEFSIPVATAVGSGPEDQIPTTFVLNQNYPNPFNQSTSIAYGLPCRTHIKLSVCNSLGRVVRVLVEGDQEAGFHRISFDDSGLPSGVYFYRLQTREHAEIRKCLLLK